MTVWRIGSPISQMAAPLDEDKRVVISRMNNAFHTDKVTTSEDLKRGFGGVVIFDASVNLVARFFIETC